MGILPEFVCYNLLIMCKAVFSQPVTKYSVNFLGDNKSFRISETQNVLNEILKGSLWNSSLQKGTQVLRFWPKCLFQHENTSQTELNIWDREWRSTFPSP